MRCVHYNQNEWKASYQILLSVIVSKPWDISTKRAAKNCFYQALQWDYMLQHPWSGSLICMLEWGFENLTAGKSCEAGTSYGDVLQSRGWHVYWNVIMFTIPFLQQAFVTTAIDKYATALLPLWCQPLPLIFSGVINDSVASPSQYRRCAREHLPCPLHGA